MSTTGLLFLFIFLPLALALYYIANDRSKEYVLLALSLIFYALGSPKYLILFILATSITVIIGRSINASDNSVSRKILLIVGIVLNACMLIYYKYADYIPLSAKNITDTPVQATSILLPLGISFFSFKAISYLVDVYKGDAVLAASPVHDALYLSFFAHIQAGPIIRYRDMHLVTCEGNSFSWDVFSNGVFRFLVGFSKKVLIANVLSGVTNEVFTTGAQGLSTALIWLGSICYSLELYLDFSGYSDMAIGISQMFGYNCPENFNYPYMTQSISKFWKRWHISLSQWFRDYIYIPLGGSRNSLKGKVYFNLLVVWLLTGIWHGSSLNFILWGFIYFVFISLERLTGFPDKFKSNIAKILYRIFALFIINIEWIIFKATDLKEALLLIKCLFVCPKNPLSDARALFLLKDNIFFILVAIILCFPLYSLIEKKLEDHKKLQTVFELLVAIVVIISFALSLSFIVAGQNNPFAYANF